MSYDRKSQQLVRLTRHMLALDDDSPSVIKLSIHPNSIHSERWIDKENYVIRTKHTQIVGVEVEVSEQEFIHERGKSFATILDMLPSSLQINANALNRLVQKIDADARWIVVGDMTTKLGNKLWVITVEMNITTSWFAKRRLIRSNETLEEVSLNAGDTEICAICLGELPAGLHVTRTPCSHVFHGRCIIRWLNKSHSCPMCRFQMQ